MWSRVEPWVAHGWGLMMVGLVMPRHWHSWLTIAFGCALLLIQFIRDKPPIRFTREHWPLIILFSLFLLNILNFLQHQEFGRAWPELERKISLGAIPVMWLLGPVRSQAMERTMFRWFTLALGAASLVMLVEASVDFMATRSVDAFFYHRLCRPVNVSAVYYSFFLLVWLMWPNRREVLRWDIGARYIHIALVVMLFLCASKLFVLLFIVLEAIQLVGNKHFKPAYLVAVLVVMIALIYPVGQRFKELKDPHLELVWGRSFTYDSPFNGLNLRLIQWRFGAELLYEQDVWLQGVGMAQKQEMLNAKYAQYGMYTGNPSLGDTGYRQFNFHNQYVEWAVGLGIPSVILLIALLLLLFLQSRPFSLRSHASLVCLSFAFMLTESVLERNQGIILTSILVCLAATADQRMKSHV